MQRTTIMLPRSLKRRVEAIARQRGLTVSELVREYIERAEQSQRERSNDPLFADRVLLDGGPSDVAENHDKYLMQFLEEEHCRNRLD